MNPKFLTSQAGFCYFLLSFISLPPKRGKYEEVIGVPVSHAERWVFLYSISRKSPAKVKLHGSKAMFRSLRA